MKKSTAILGASNKAERYSYKAFKMLCEYGHPVYPVHPFLKEIEGVQVYSKLSDIKDPIDTLTIYLGPKHIEAVIDDIIKLNPLRIILNPGTESKKLINALEEANMNYIEACTLVLLRTGQY